MKFGSLFSGIGGIDLGLERAGLTCAWQVEIDDYCQRVLASHWPEVPRFRDVREVGKHNLCSVGLIAGGFPCQDISIAGRGAGIGGGRSGLWGEFARIVCEVRPRFVLVENVAELLRRGIGRVLGDLADLGYDAEWRRIDACEVGAPHQRARIWILASDPREKRVEGFLEETLPRFPVFSWSQDVRGPADVRGRSDLPPPLFRGGRDGIPDWVDRIGSCGNAVVPQIVEWIGRRIMNRTELLNRR